LILNRIKGATSFQDLRTHEKIVYDTYRDAAIAMGLIEHETQILNIFEEVSNNAPYTITKIFRKFSCM
jgi:hypothetical protein